MLRLAAIAERGDHPQIHVFDLRSFRKKKSLVAPDSLLCKVTEAEIRLYSMSVNDEIESSLYSMSMIDEIEFSLYSMSVYDEIESIIMQGLIFYYINIFSLSQCAIFCTYRTYHTYCLLRYAFILRNIYTWLSVRMISC